MERICGLLFVLSFIILSGCGLETKTLLQFHDEDLSDITKIVILDGNTGYQKTIEDIAKLNIFIKHDIIIFELIHIIPRIILVIWTGSFYRVTVNYSTMDGAYFKKALPQRAFLFVKHFSCSEGKRRFKWN